MTLSGFNILGKTLSNPLRRMATSGLAAVMCSALLTASPLTSQAMASYNAGIENSGWAVNEISSQNTSGAGDSYCVMARKFENEAILSIAENHKGQKSLAIDFQTPRLEQSRIYKVVLRAGGEMARAFEVRPVTSKAFVVRLGYDQAFFKAIENQENLSVFYEGGRVNFDGLGFRKGHKALRGCLNNQEPELVMASATGNQGLSGYSGGSDKEHTSHKAEREAKDITHNERAPETRMASLETAAGDEQAISSDSNKNKLKEQVTKQKSEIQQLEERLAQLEQENRSLKAAVSRSKTESPEKLATVKEENSKLNQTLDRILSQNLELKTGLDKANQKIAEAEQKIAAYRAQNSEIRQVENQASASQEVAQENKRLAQENSLLKQRLAQIKSEQLKADSDLQRLSMMKNELARAQNKVDTLSSEKQDLLNQLAKIEKENKLAQKVSADPEMCLSSMNWNLEMATRRYQEAQKEIRRLGSKLRNSKQNCQRDIHEIEDKLFRGGDATQVRSERFTEMRKRLVKMSDELKKQRVMAKRQVRELEEQVEKLKDVALNKTRDYADSELASIDSLNKKRKPYELRQFEAREDLDRQSSDETLSSTPVAQTKEETQTVNLANKPGSKPANLRSEEISSKPGANNSVSQAERLSRSDDKLRMSQRSRKILLSHEASPIKSENIQRLVSAAELPVSGKINVFGPNGAIWDTGSMMASAHKVKYSDINGSGYNQKRESYLDLLKSQCQGTVSLSKVQKTYDSDSKLYADLYRMHCDQEDSPVFKTILMSGSDNANSEGFFVLSHEAHLSSVNDLNSVTSKLKSFITSGGSSYSAS